MIGGGLAAFLLLGGIIDALTAGETETATEPAARATTTAVAAPTTTEFQGMMVRELITSPDEAAFVTGVERRTELSSSFSTGDLLGWAVRGCELGDQYIMGSQPFWVDVLADVIGSETALNADDADDLATAVANASSGTVCTVEVVDANG